MAVHLDRLAWVVFGGQRRNREGGADQCVEIFEQLPERGVDLPLREELPTVTDDDVFETILSLVIGGLTQVAPRACGCHPHEPQSVEIDRP